MMKKLNISSKKRKALKIILITLISLLLVVLLLAVSAFAYYKSKLKLIQHPEDIVDYTDDVDDANGANGANGATDGNGPGSDDKDNNGEGSNNNNNENNKNNDLDNMEIDIDDPEVDDVIKEINDEIEEIIKDLPEEQKDSKPELPEIEKLEDNKVYNILLIGTDERSKKFNTNARGDSCMLLSLNTYDYSMRLVSFERGMGVPILEGKYKGSYDWLTHTFRYGGADLMMRTVRECFKVDVNYYVRVNFATFKDGINAIGGVDINLTAAEANYINNDVKYDGVSKGWNHLNGEQALSYARCRHIDSDWHRIERQRNVVQAAMNQMKGLNVFELNDALNELLPLVLTNMPDSMITKLLLLVPKFQGKTAQQMTIPAKGTYGGMKGLGGRSLFSVDFKKNAQILRDFLYPKTKSNTAFDAANGTGVIGAVAPSPALWEAYKRALRKP